MFGNLVGVAINAVFLSYIKKLEVENCECSEDKLRDYIKYFSSAMIGLFLLSFLLALLSVRVKVPRVLRMLLSLVILGAGLYQVYALFKYSHKLTFSKPECECSKDWRRTFMFYISIFYAILLTLFAIQFVLVLIRLSTMSKTDKKQLMNAVKRAQSKRGSRN